MKKHYLFPFIILLSLSTLLPGCSRSNQEATPTTKAIGKPAPDFVLKDTKGKTWHLAELKGKVVFVNFWATWCPPCRGEMPSMQELSKSLPPNAFQMLAILSNDQAEVAEKFAGGIGFAAPILLDPENRASKAYGTTGVPETYIIDKTGVLREAIIGAMDWNSPEARRMLAGYL
jgi:peroxiredoxin